MAGKQALHRLSWKEMAKISIIVSLHALGELSTRFKIFTEILIAMAYWRSLFVRLKSHGLQPLHLRSLWMAVPIVAYFAKYRLQPFQTEEPFGFKTAFAVSGGSTVLVVISTLYDVGRAYERITKQS